MSCIKHQPSNMGAIHVVLLIILALIMRATGKYITGDCLDKAKALNVCKDELKVVDKRIDELQRANKILQEKVDSMNKMLKQQQTIPRSERNDLEDIKTTLKNLAFQITSENQAQYNTIQSELKNILKSKMDSDTMRESELQKDLMEIKSTLKSSESKIILDKQNELKHDLDDIRTTLKTVLSQITSQNLAQNKLKINSEEAESIRKNDFMEIRSALISLESRTIPDKIQQNEWKNDLKEIEFNLKTDVSQLLDKFDNSTNSCRQISQSVSETTTKQSAWANCDEALQMGGKSGVYKIKIPNSDLEPFDVYCLTRVANVEVNSSENATAWMVVQRRKDGSEDFDRNWTDYQKGFGNLDAEFFLGLDKLHALTQSKSHQLWIQMETDKGTRLWAKYDRFAIAGASDSYALDVLGAYTGSHTGDALAYSKGTKWTTKDVDNDTCDDSNCAVDYSGAWWYGCSSYSSLNGRYSNPSEFWWYSGSEYYYLKYSHMAIRPIQ